MALIRTLFLASLGLLKFWSSAESKCPLLGLLLEPAHVKVRKINSKQYLNVIVCVVSLR